MYGAVCLFANPSNLGEALSKNRQFTSPEIRRVLHNAMKRAIRSVDSFVSVGRDACMCEPSQPLTA